MVAERAQILAHRGLWKELGLASNAPRALELALELGYSLETDVRDSALKVVLEHDPVLESRELLTLSDLLIFFVAKKSEGQCLALNVKADGLVELISKVDLDLLMEISHVYFFDMSIPETLRFSKAGLPFAQRFSEFEPLDFGISYNWPSKPCAYWIDGFETDWYLGNGGFEILKLSESALVTIVSPELHGRDNGYVLDWFWKHSHSNPGLRICTDYPEEYLGEKSH